MLGRIWWFSALRGLVKALLTGLAAWLANVGVSLIFKEPTVA